MDEVKLEDVIALLNDVKEGPDYATRTDLVDARVLDSFDILSLISSIDDEFDVSVPAKDVVPENFNSAAAIRDMIARLEEED